MRYASVRLSSSPRFVVSIATVNRARSRASTTRVYGLDAHCKRALNGDTEECRGIGNCRCLLNRQSRFLLFFSCERHVLCDQITSDWVADPEGIAQVGGDAEIALISHGQFGNVVYPHGIVCVPLCTFSRLG